MNKKEFYASPEAETFEMRFEGMVCTSPMGNPTVPESADVNDQSGDSTKWW